MRILFTLIYALFLTSPIAFSQVAHTEATGSYSGLFLAYEPSEMFLDLDETGQASHYFEQNVFTTTMIAMYPGKIFGFGIEVPIINRKIRFSREGHQVQNISYREKGDLRLVAKYQFGIYKKYHFLGRKRLLNMLVSLVGKLKLPSAITNISNSDGVVLAPFFQPGTGSTDMTLGFIFHTDTQKYFRIHGHFTTTFPLAHAAFSPGKKVNFTLSYILARLGVGDRYYPYLGFKGWWKGEDYLDRTPLSNTEGLHLYLAPGLRSTWWYFSSWRMFCMLQSAFQIKLLETNHVMRGPSYGFYLGTRIFFR